MKMLEVSRNFPEKCQCIIKLYGLKQAFKKVIAAQLTGKFFSQAKREEKISEKKLQ